MVLELHILLLALIVAGAAALGLLIGVAVARGRPRAGGGRETAPASGAERGAAEAGAQAEALPAPTQAALIVNPSKDMARAAVALLGELCAEKGWPAPLVFETEPEDAGGGQARAALEAGADLVIVAGGDGTVRLVAEQLVGTEVPMGIVPAGTGNLLARNLDMVLDHTEGALRIALDGRDSVIDTGAILLGGREEPHTFLVMAGIGFDAAVMSDVSPARKAKVGWLAYVEAGSRKLLGSRVSVRVRVDEGEERELKVRSVVAGNCGRLQGGVWLFPEAEIDDGQLDLLVVSPKNLAEWVGVVASIAGRLVRRGLHTATAQGERFSVRVEHPVEVQIDGDPFGTTDRMELSVMPASLVVRAPTPELKRRIRLEQYHLSSSPFVSAG
ncbi:diacylglycerol/lipid kinase family protein [Brevibacterium album]|uniref:diacylglycerol/lipid kinase family protein n=1 Tax=Brevibacterium album TaxID=417948 RepID=UPI00040AFA89|nr:diacylglycerol kinase family protein [Brevibacterium album]